jgi:uncharacterized phiE125 gp8 family phage protein
MADRRIRVAMSELAAPLLTPEDARLHLRITDDQEDPEELLQAIQTATSEVEQITGQVLRPATVTLHAGAWSSGQRLLLPVRPVRSVTSISVMLTDAPIWTELDSDTYRLTRDGRWIVCAGGWPSVATAPDAIEVVCAAGYETAADVPEVLRAAVLDVLDLRWHYHQPPDATRRREQLLTMLQPHGVIRGGAAT